MLSLSGEVGQSTLPDQSRQNPGHCRPFLVGQNLCGNFQETFEG